MVGEEPPEENRRCGQLIIADCNQGIDIAMGSIMPRSSFAKDETREHQNGKELEAD